MIDKAICAFNRFVVNFFASLTITVKTPFIDFSFVPLIVTPKGFIIQRLLPKPVEGVILYIFQACMDLHITGYYCWSYNHRQFLFGNAVLAFL